MAAWADVRRVALSFPGASEQTSGQGTAQWRVAGRMFLWERPLRASDLAALGDAAPTGPVLGVRVPDLGAKEAWLADRSDALFTTPHFDDAACVLAQLDLVDADLLVELAEEAWCCRARPRDVQAYLASRG